MILKGVKDAVRKIEAGSRSSYAIIGEGKLFVWGHNGHGQLGLDDCKIRIQPHKTKFMLLLMLPLFLLSTEATQVCI